MGLGFLVPAFLAGLAALLVPIVIHMRHREWEKPHRFPSLMFLRRIPIRTARRRRITDWLLLALRASVFALLVAAFARPFLRRDSAVAGEAPPRAVVLALDRSLSMGHRNVWGAALDSARRIIAALRPADRLALVLFDEEAEVAAPLGVDRAGALASLGAARPGSRATRYAAALRAGRQLLSIAGGAAGEVIVVSDLQRSGLGGLAGLELPADLTVRTVVVQPPTRANTALIGAEIQRVAAGQRSELLVVAQLLARELGARRTARLSLTVNGRPAASREVSLPPDGAVTAAFERIPLPAGRARAELVLDADALAGDDTLRFVVPAEQDLRVLLLVPQGVRAEETLFLERALGIGRDPRIAVERRLALEPAALRTTGAVVLFDTPGTAALAAPLERWVEAGGGLIVAAASRLAARAPSGALFAGTPRGSVDRLADRGGTFGEVTLDHPIFAPFREGGGAALSGARFLRYPRVEPAPGAEVLARFDDGAPAVLEKRLGAGKLLFLAVPLDGLAGDFPLQPAYLPFLRRLIVAAAGRQAAPLWRSTGETGIVPSGVANPVIATPAGALLRPASDSGPCTVVLSEAGFYSVYAERAAGDPVELLAANPPVAESDLTPADARELLLGVRRSDSLATGLETNLTAAEREGRQRIWSLLLAGVVVLLLLETFVANRGARGTAANVVPAPPERNLP